MNWAGTVQTDRDTLTARLLRAVQTADGPVTVRTLADAGGLDRATVSGIVARLYWAGYVNRWRVPQRGDPHSHPFQYAAVTRDRRSRAAAKNYDLAEGSQELP